MSGNYRVALTSSPLLPSLFFFSNFSFNKNQILYRKIEKMNKIVANSSLFLQTPLLPNFNDWKRNSFRFFKLGKNSFKRWRKGEGRGPPRNWIFISNYARWEKRFLLLFVRIKTAPSVDWLNPYTISSPLKIHHPANIPPPLLSSFSKPWFWKSILQRWKHCCSSPFSRKRRFMGRWKCGWLSRDDPRHPSEWKAFLEPRWKHLLGANAKLLSKRFDLKY